MPDTAIARRVRRALEKPYDPTALVNRLLELLKQHNESYREAALRCGMDHQAVRRILSGQRPSMVTCILMADHFGLNPNEFLLLAGLPTLKVFDIHTESTEALPVEAVEVAKAVAKIQNPKQRKEVSQAILTLLTQYFD
jgi:transcriptional regulator with XRE-family HTH domain